MRIELAENLGETMLSAQSADALHEALARSSRDMGFDHFALSLEIGCGSEAGASVLIHDYPPAWADVYVGFNLASTDPVRRAAERSMLGFRWADLEALIPVTEAERIMFDTGRRHGIADGYTIPRHLPGEVTASCSFVSGTECELPTPMFLVAELLGATAIAQARRISGWVPPLAPPRITDRQRDCILWAARGKTDQEISEILNISRETVIQHLKDARERYYAHNRASLILAALFDGLISFADIFRWRKRH